MSQGARRDGDELNLRDRLLTPRTLLSTLLAVVLLVLLFWVLLRVDLAAMLDLVLRADPILLAAAFVTYYASFPLRGWRWRYLLTHAGIRVSLRDATEIFSLGWYVNLLAPARLGDVYRAYLLRTHADAKLSKVFGTLLLERVADILGVFVLAVAAGLWSFRGRIGPEVQSLLLVGIGIATAVVVLVTVLRVARGWVARHLPERAASIWEGLQQGAAGSLTPARAGVVAGVTATIWLLEGLRLYLVIAALGAPIADVGFGTALFVALIGALFSILPLTPAGIGLVEGGIVYALTVYGIGTDAAAAVAVTDRSITLLSVLVLGSLLYAASRKTRLGR